MYKDIKTIISTLLGTEEDECEPNPCQNGGRCVAHYFGGGFDCECPLGFRGTTCLGKFSKKSNSFIPNPKNGQSQHLTNCLNLIL